MTPTIQAVVFDFDYTLADASPGIVHSFRATFEVMKLVAPEPDRVRRTIGMSLPHAFRELSGVGDPDAAQRFMDIYHAQASAVMLAKTRVFETVVPCLERLRDGGSKCAIVSTKTRRRIEDVLERDELSAFFETVIGGEDVMTHKPDPEGLLLCLDRLSVAPSATLYVGDSRIDAETAQGAGTHFQPVLTGVTPPEHFEGLPGRAPIGSLAELKV
ncbi:MAG: HAD-IA family hydrolase [Planctomycetota bacterium]